MNPKIPGQSLSQEFWIPPTVFSPIVIIILLVFPCIKRNKENSRLEREPEMEEERRVGVAIDFSSCSKKALIWAVENLIRSGDHLILVNVQSSRNYEEGEMQLWETTGSPLIPFNDFSDPPIAKKYGVKPDDETLDLLRNAATQFNAVVLMKIFWGDPREKLCEAIDKIPLSALVVGSRGLSKIKRILLGSVSNYLVNNGGCPITVVRSTEQEHILTPRKPDASASASASASPFV